MESLAFLHLLQVFDSQFPVGGIETYAQLRFDADSLRELIANQIRFGWGRLDLAAGSLAWRSPADHETLESLAAELHAYKIIPRGGLGRKTSRPSPHLPDCCTGNPRSDSPLLPSRTDLRRVVLARSSP